jgi:hypothetical protein
MGIDTRCGLMVGLPYKELKALVNGFDEDVYDIDIDELIDNGELEIGSIGYDSSRKDNIVGLFVHTTGSFSVLTEHTQSESTNAREELENMIPTIDWKLYLTLDVT